MAIIKRDETGTKLFLNPIGELFNDSVHQIKMEVCVNPTCNCGDVNMILETENINGYSEVEYNIPIEVHKELVNHLSEDTHYFREPNKAYVADLLSDSLSKDDWNKLRGLYFNHKLAFIEQVNPHEIDFEFEKEDLLEKSLRFPYFEIFPCSVFHLKLNEERYLGFDNYCKNPACDCNDISISMLQIDNINAGKTIKIGEIWYNYKTQQVKFEGNDEAHINSIFTKLKAKEINFDQLVEQRNKNIKIIYENAYKKYAPKYAMPDFNKIGRNDLCFCGSGKKYKKCCLNKWGITK